MTRHDTDDTARKIAARQKRAGDAPSSPPATIGRPAVRTRPVRVTVDLSPGAYRDLTDASRELASQTGRTRVTHVDIVRALLDELHDDPELRARVAGRLAP